MSLPPAREEHTTRQPAARLVGEDQSYLLFPGQAVRLGRSEENEIILNDGLVSRLHAIIEWGEGPQGPAFRVRDAGSVNGTQVNGLPVSQDGILLSNGDRLTLGSTRLVYESLPAVPRTAPLAQHRGTGGRTPPSLDLLTARPRGPRVVVVRGPDTGQEYPLWGEQVTIGRASREATWEIRLTDRSVSRPHACIEKAPGGYSVRDLDSANGTRVNGARIQAEGAVLEEGDVIAIGETQLVFHR